MIGVSPIRPLGLPVIPPVEVAAATFPCTSRATAPTVPIPSISWSSTESSSSVAPGRAFLSFHRFHCFCRSSVMSQVGSTGSTPCSIANSSAASLLSITGQPCLRIQDAARIGWRIRRTLTTEPAAPSRPFMIEASIVTLPSSSSTEPIPALNNGSFSINSTACVTASNAWIEPD